ncbi:hypothetical protein R9C00_18010 [Flammeovirgaceae bacterium SG7u.111]|nr:hypothetical protein [Flammeovirgaceae bacterium SG7u.132]WPO33600.1 hypothetical protein R9C00_18010 [Flammeovirgaceae bacterium SG7u.111]
MQKIKVGQKFEKNCYAYKVVNRVMDIAILEQRYGGKLIAYEVVKIQNQKPRVLPSGIVSIEKEVLPSTSSWGKLGWTVGSWERAKEKQKECLS